MLMNNKVVIITGAASRRGLGLASARLLAEHGARLVIADLDAQASRDAAAGLPGGGDRHAGIGCDVTKKADCDALAEQVARQFGRIDVLVNNAGVSSPLKLLDVQASDYDRVMDVSMRGSLYMTQAVVPAMRRQRAGSIVNMSSVSAQRGGGIFGGTHYSAAKGAVLGYTKACARELGPDNIRVNAICPSLIDTDITGGALTPERLTQILASIPLGRVGQASEVAGCVLFLASDLSSYVTGSEIDINGGSHIH